MVVSGVRLLDAATSDGRSVSDSSHYMSVNHIGSTHADRMSWHPAPANRHCNTLQAGVEPPFGYTIELAHRRSTLTAMVNFFDSWQCDRQRVNAFLRSEQAMWFLPTRLADIRGIVGEQR